MKYNFIPLYIRRGIYTFYEKRECLKAFALVRGKNGEDLRSVPFNCFVFLSLGASWETCLTS
jgi:hypothetical protein